MRNVRVTKQSLQAKLCHCENCDFLFLEDPNWLAVAYQDEFYGDTGYVKRNIETARLLRLFFSIARGSLGSEKEVFACDIGTGLGMLPRLMRDNGFGFFGYDEFSKMQLIRPFVLEDTRPIEVKTAFEVVEHLPSLPDFLRDHSISSSKLFVFSTLLRSDCDIPDSSWWYYALSAGQHISFHSRSSILYALASAGIPQSSFISLSSQLHILTPCPRMRRFFRLAFYLRRKHFDDFLVPFLFKNERKSLTWSDHYYAMSLLD